MKSTMRNGLFTISLDFELHWGVFDVFDDEYKQNLEGARKVVPEILKQFNTFNIHGTWAAVGFLFARSKKEMEEWSPQKVKRPTYLNKEYSSYRVDTGKDENADPIHFAQSLIEQIKSAEGQEIATHTFSHYYCLENGQTIEQFEADIKATVEAAKKLNIELQSIVFPRNQVNSQYLPVLRKYGITSYRGVETARVYEANNTRKYNRINYKVGRFTDSYFNITGYETHDLHSLDISNGILNIPGSRFFRPYSPNLFFLEPLKLRRIKKSMEYAAKNNQIYHLWWHPHNFGVDIEKNIANLKEILTYYQLLSNQYGMQSVMMKEIVELFKNKPV